MFSEAKEEVYSYAYWFRKKYKLAPTDNRFLDVTMSTIKKEFLLERLSEDKDFKLEELTKDTSKDDEWMLEQERETTNDVLKDVFEGKFKPKEKQPIEEKIRPTGMGPIEAARNKVRVSVKSKFENKIIPLGDDEVVFTETNPIK